MAGLRREEVAVLAGVDDADYYTRLEQGKERHPSAQVLDALSRALLLEVDAPDHLRRPRGGRLLPKGGWGRRYGAPRRPEARDRRGAYAVESAVVNGHGVPRGHLRT